MTTKTRIYTVRDTETSAIHLVEASTAAAARHHVTASRFSVEAASALAVARFMSDEGLQVQVAGVTADRLPADDTEGGAA